MTPSECARCTEKITRENDSDEHVIPAAIGGRMTVRGFLCERCNNQAGEHWDGALAMQLNTISVLLAISRHGSPPRATMDMVGGERIALDPAGATTFGNPQPINKASRGIVGTTRLPPNPRVVKDYIKKLRRKYPDARIESHKGFAFLPGVRHASMSFGGSVASRSVVKTAMALAVKNGIHPGECDVARPFLRDDSITPESCLGFYYSDCHDIVNERPPQVLHCVAVRGDPKTRSLIGYVEYFGAYRMIVVLSRQYRGREFRDSYAIDPLEGKPLPIQCDLRFTEAEIDSNLKHERVDETVREAAFATLFRTAFERRLDREESYYTKEVIKDAAERAGEQASSLVEQIRAFTAVVQESMGSFVLHNSSWYGSRPDDLGRLMNTLGEVFEEYLRKIVERRAEAGPCALCRSTTLDMDQIGNDYLVREWDDRPGCFVVTCKHCGLTHIRTIKE